MAASAKLLTAMSVRGHHKARNNGVAAQKISATNVPLPYSVYQKHVAAYNLQQRNGVRSIDRRGGGVAASA